MEFFREPELKGVAELANPKHRHTRVRRDKRRTHWKPVVPNLVPCPQCHEPRLAHHVCPNCGYYDGREVVAVKPAKAAEG